MTYETSLIERVSAPVFALASGRNGTFLAWNRAMAQVTGITGLDAIGRTPVEVLGPKASGLSLSPPGAVQVPGLGLAVFERHEDMLLGTLQDRERETYIGMAAHDLRAPLRNILFLAEEALDPQADTRELVSKIAKVARNGMALTGDVVACAQQFGYQDYPAATVELAPLAASVMASLDPSGIHDLDCEASVLTVEKPVLLAVLRNLLDNAIRQSRVARQFRIGASADKGGIQLRISDNGTGLKDSALAFLSGGKFRPDSGFGLLGLRRLVHSRGGRIAVEPGENGKGSAVVVTLPGDFAKLDRQAIAS